MAPDTPFPPTSSPMPACNAGVLTSAALIGLHFAVEAGPTFSALTHPLMACAWGLLLGVGVRLFGAKSALGRARRRLAPAQATAWDSSDLHALQNADEIDPDGRAIDRLALRAERAATAWFAPCLAALCLALILSMAASAAAKLRGGWTAASVAPWAAGLTLGGLLVVWALGLRSAWAKLCDRWATRLDAIAAEERRSGRSGMLDQREQEIRDAEAEAKRIAEKRKADLDKREAAIVAREKRMPTEGPPPVPKSEPIKPHEPVEVVPHIDPPDDF